MSQIVNELHNVTLVKYNNNHTVDITVVIPKINVMKSIVFSSVIDSCNDGRVVFPNQFNDVFDDYVKYCYDPNNLYKVDNVKLCLALFHYLEDTTGFQLLVTKLLYQLASQSLTSLTSSTITMLKQDNIINSDISDLNMDVQHEVYMLCPYYFLPDRYVTNNGLFNQWLSVNKHKKFCVDGMQYYCEVAFAIYQSDIICGENKKCSKPTQMVKDVVPLCKYLSDTSDNKIIHGMFRSWNHKGNLMLSSPYNYGKKHGVHKVWHYNSGKLLLETCYDNNIKHGGTKVYHWSGMLHTHNNYCQGVKHGIQIRYLGLTVRCKLVYHYGNRIEAYEYDEFGKIVNQGTSVVEWTDQLL